MAEKIDCIVCSKELDAEDIGVAYEICAICGGAFCKEECGGQDKDSGTWLCDNCR